MNLDSFNSLHKTILFCILFVPIFSGINANICYSQINISYSNFGYTIGPRGEPILACELIATSNGTPIELNTTNTKIIQSGAAFVTNITIEPPKPNGTQTVTWGLEIGLPHNVEFEVLVTLNQDVGSTQLPGLPEFDGYNAAFYYVDLNGKQQLIQLADFTNTNRQYVYLFVAGDYGATSPISSRPWIDSITFTNPNITYNWQAYPPASSFPPPVQVFFSNLYRIELNYDEPPGHPYMRDWMIIHFGGNIKYRFELVAHEFNIDNKHNLTLLHPNGGEHFAPCEEVLIQWKGQNPDYNTRLDFSNDGGTTWSLIDIIPGSNTSYLWTVPATISDNCYIKVQQTGTSPAIKSMGYDSAKILSAVFNEINNNTATKILTASSLNNIVEWDLFAGTFVNRITTVHIGDTSLITSAIYTDNNRIVALDSRKKQLLFYNSGDNALQKNVQLTNLPATYKPFAMQCDAKQRFIMIEPEKEYGNTLIFTDTAGNYITTLTENTAFTDVYLSEVDDKIYYSLIDNTIKAVSLANFPNLSTSSAEQFDFAKDYNIINALSVSNDGNMIGITTRKPAPKDIKATLTQQTDNVIFDKRIGNVYKNLKVNISSGTDICFSPASTITIIASPEPTQIIAFDLTVNQTIRWAIPTFDNFCGLTVSKNGNAMVARSAGAYNTTYMPFAMPEFDLNDAPFVIKTPSLAFADSSLLKLNNLLIGTADTTTLDMQLCNNGLSKVEITAAAFEDRSSFELDQSQTAFPIVLLPGACATIHIVAHPNDTGLISRNLRFTDNCGQTYDFPFSIIGINRKLILHADTIDFGDVCATENVTFTNRPMFYNDDTVDVFINYIANISATNFSMELSTPLNIILKPGDTLFCNLTFNAWTTPPTEIGLYTGYFNVYYEDQQNVMLQIPVRANVVSTELTVSSEVLPFIPEEPTRTFTLTNAGKLSVTITSVLSEKDNYTSNVEVPFILEPGESIEISVTCNNPEDIQTENLKIFTEPFCGIRTIELKPYSGTAHLTIPDLQADPKNENFEIPIHFTQTENYPYNGQRPFEGTISLNTTLFYPKSAESDYGEVTILANQTVGNTRNISFRLNGNITDASGVLLRLYGYAMLGDADFTDIEWNDNSKFFGKSVSVTTDGGSLTLINLCEDRLVSMSYLSHFDLISIAPTPAQNVITVNYEVQGDIDLNENCLVEIHNLNGQLLLQKNINGNIGKHSELVDITSLTTGNYLLSLLYGKQKISLVLLKVE